ncbi:hypothetical protein D3C84_1011240 [compost metagenome]
MLGQFAAWRDDLFDIGHRLLDIGNLPQWVTGGIRPLNPAFHIVGKRRVVPLDAGRPEALEDVEDVLKLEEDGRRRGATQAKAAQMLEFIQHIHQG